MLNVTQKALQLRVLLFDAKLSFDDLACHSNVVRVWLHDAAHSWKVHVVCRVGACCLCNLKARPSDADGRRHAYPRKSSKNSDIDLEGHNGRLDSSEFSNRIDDWKDSTV